MNIDQQHEQSATGRARLALRLYEAGRPVREILTEVGLAQKTLYRVTRAAGSPGRQQPSDQHNVDEALRLYETTDLSPEVIHTLTGVSRGLLHYHRRQQGLPLRAPSAPAEIDLTPEMVEALRQYADTEKPLAEILSRTGVKRSAFAWARKSLGVPARPWVTPPSKTAAVLEALQSGANYADAAARGGVAVNTARRIGPEAGLAANRPRRTPAATEASVIADLRAGRSANSVRLAHRIGAGTVLRIAGDAGIVLAGAGKSKPKPPQTRAAVVAEIRSGATATEAAGRHGIDISTAAQWAKQEGIELSQTSRATRRVRKLEPLIIAELEQRKPVRQVAATHGVDGGTVAQIRDRAGIAALRSSPRPIRVCDLDDLAQQLAEIQAQDLRAPRTVTGYESAFRVFVSWCEKREPPLESLPAHPDTVSAYLEHQALHGRSGRLADRGQPTGWSAPTIKGAARAISDRHSREGYPDPTAQSDVKDTVERLARIRPNGTESRNPIRADHVKQLRSLPPPDPSVAVSVTRLAMMVAGGHGANPEAVAWQTVAACASGSIRMTGEDVSVVMPAYPPRSAPQLHLHLAHRADLGETGCDHCVAADVARSVADGEWVDAGIDREVHNLRRRWRRASVRCQLGDKFAAPRSEPERLRLSIHMDRRLVAYFEQHAAQAILRSTQIRVSELVELDLADVVTESAGRKVTVRRRKNDQTGNGHTIGIAADGASGALAMIGTWCWLRGPAPGALFPGSGGADHRHPTTIEARLRANAEAVGLGLDRIGPHGFRSGGIIDLLEAGQSFFLVAKQVGITEQVMFDHYLRQPEPFSASISHELGLVGP